MSLIKFFSTNGHLDRVDFKGALLAGQAPDKGLYMPEMFPSLSPETIRNFPQMSYHQIAYQVIKPYLGDLVEESALEEMLKDAYSYEVPLERVYDGKYLLRLDRGPTCSFKDFAARLMGRLMQYFLKEEGRSMIILTATSGDTGSAVAHAFYGLENIKVIVLFPEREVTERQRRQMTTLGENIYPLAVTGKFDDCQALVKQAFVDPELKGLELSSANSINVGRLLPQAVYYFYAHSRVAPGGEEVVFSVPSGNFGDLMGGLIALKMGLPVKKFVAATNENDEFPRFMQTGVYEPIRPSRNCISNAMNVGHPSNLARLFSLYGGQMDETGQVARQPDLSAMREEIYAVSISDEETRQTIREAYSQYKVLLEPHGAVGWAGLVRYLKEFGDWSPAVSLETADPAKFPDEIVRLTGVNPSLPPAMASLDEKEENFLNMDGSYASLKDYLKGFF
ncbi:MAG: threonine synthase [Methanothrix soehngenii]|jgi:threonine synthase|uniref:threonine synthase n=1 Tax=Methanothrix soehngenii TaxID=2223 RepID=UPI0023F2BF88|nr:threonine synthase [Methanothrix soehngenii]MCK9586728.1 threonine synthase [Methanothrix soehngenii]MDD3973349.1 threonine synthase [Methanothrix soehngenii]MDD5258066.1 threonine synthase [Methanothrix soehngenii]MDD5734480.1 threonine synthase [Methanothrix soehngenii]